MIVIFFPINSLSLSLFVYTGSQWGWLPYDIAPTETLPFVCEIPIRETYGIMTNYRGIGK
jgi:hypothetical protein